MNETQQSERKTKNPRQSLDTSKHMALDCLSTLKNASVNSNFSYNSATHIVSLDVRSIDNLESEAPPDEMTELLKLWREVVKPGFQRMSGGDGRGTMSGTY